ncbi:MAG: DUF1062 domain-containing protein [Myxococcota bacterium]
MASLPVPSFVFVPRHGRLPCLVWRVHADGPPRTERWCPRCDTVRTHISRRRFRVNAQGRRLDVWLLVGCVRCDHTDRLTVHHRVSVESLPPALLDAYTTNVPATCDAAAHRLGLTAPWALEASVAPGPFAARLSVADGATVRLDRLLAAALGWSRSETAAQVRRGTVDVLEAGTRALRRPAVDGQIVVVTRSG